jgi:hypothetical protein
MLAKAGLGLRFNEHLEGDGPTVFAHACKMGLEGIVSKRKDSAYRSGRSPDWLKMKNPEASAVKREAEEDWGAGSCYGHSGRCVGEHFGFSDTVSVFGGLVGCHFGPSNRAPSPNDLVFVDRQWRRRGGVFSELLEASDHLRAAGQNTGLLRTSAFTA